MKIPFIPIQGPESKIQQQNVVQGNLYFTTDTGKILLDTNEGRIVLGASGAAVFYANASGLRPNTDDSYTISFQTLDDQNAIPKKDDLIINADGRFFRVNYFFPHETEAFVNCKLIAVSGTGGSTGGGGGATPEENPKVIDVFYHDLQYAFLYGSNYEITLTATAKLDTSLNVSYVVVNANGRTVDLGSVSMRSGDTVSLPVGKNIAPDGTYHGVTITITGANSLEYSTTINKIRCIDLRVENDTENFVSQTIYDGSVSYYVTLKGQIQKTLYIEIDGKQLINPIQSPETEHNISKYVNINCENLNLDTGVHTITAYLIAGGVVSNKVYTDFIYHPVDAEDTTYVIVTDYPTSCLSYETPAIHYWVKDTSKAYGTQNVIVPSINGVNLDAIYETQTEGKDGELIWNVSGLIPDQNNTLALTCNGTTREISIYCEYSDIFDPVAKDAVLMLGAEGRSNNTSLERRLQWKYTNDKNQTIAANLINFNWKNNGWITDENGRGCLRISNDAKVEIPLTLFNNELPTTGGFTFEFEFKPYNLYSYNLLTKSTKTIEIDNGDDNEDEEVEVQRTYNADLASITYIQGTGEDAYGVCCGTQDAYFRMHNGDSAAVRYMENQIVNITVTINAARKQICMYVNGVMSGMTAYKNSARLPIEASKIIINSEQCDLDVYNIRVYNAALTPSEVVQNYVANKKDLTIQAENNFVSGDTVQLEELRKYNTDNPNNATIPYIVFKTTAAPDLLPYNKANADVVCDIEFTNPALDHALALGVIDENYYKKHAPSFLATNVVLNVQGTSSQKYPRKNFKGKFKNATSWNCTNKAIKNKALSKFYMRDDIAEKTFTWKADYMDSSSSHNTGFASFVYDLYKNHPLDYYEGTNVNLKDTVAGIYHQKYRTSLFGFPVLAFHEKSDGTTEFIGRYNFNLDKGADNTLGMAEEKVHPYVTGTFDEEQKDKTVIQKPLDYAHICECWEMANNMGGRCSFRGNPFDAGYDYERELYVAYDKEGNEIEGHSDLGDDLEVRYHINGDAIEGAWKNRNLPEDDKDSVIIGSKAAFNVLLGGNADGTGRTGAYTHLEKFFNWINSCFYAFELSNTEDQTWVRRLLDRDDEVMPTDEDYLALVAERKAKFESEFNDHLNMEYCLVYYIMTELLLQFDSRGKNMMFASWGPMKQGGDYVWFPIYYDIDTQLGVNNSGIPSWEYNVEPTTGKNNSGGAKAFSTNNSLLWQNFHASYVENNPEIIREAYRRLRGGNLSIANLNGYYNFDYSVSGDYCMKGIIPINVINANQIYKYIDPSTKGYVNGIDDNGKPKMRTTSAYFYCLQGTRELHRALFLRNRFNYYDSKWMAQSYQPGVAGATAVFLRANAHKNEQDASLNSNLLLKVKPSLDQYLVMWLDDSATNVYPVFVEGGKAVEIDLRDYMTNTEDYTQQIVYIGGPEYIQEYGDVSLLYVDEFEYKSPSITKIEMGNENPYYDPDPNYDVSKLQEATKDKPLLKVFDVTNISGGNKEITSVELLDAVKLEEFRALGTSLTEVNFADGVNIQKLYLPSSLVSIELKNAMALDKIVYTEDEIYELDDEGNRHQNVSTMYIADVVTDNGNKTKINRVHIVSGGLKQYSYELLKKITNARYVMIDKDDATKLQVTMEDVHWTPYTQLGDGAEYIIADKNNYFYATNNASFEMYNYTTQEKWNSDILSGRIYHYDESPVEMATNLGLLDIYINDNKAHFTNVSSMAEKDYPLITGSMYINNTAATPVSEADLFNKYAIYFPDLDIRAKHIEDAYRARFVSYDNGVEKEIYTQRVAKNQTGVFVNPPPKTNIPLPSHSVFEGWSLVRPTGIYEEDKKNIISYETIVNTYKFGNANSEFEKPEYVFYAIYNRESYTITFKDTRTIPGETTIFNYVDETKRYGDAIQEPEEIPYRAYEESKMDLTKRLAFKGWTTVEANSGVLASEIAVDKFKVDISNYTADRDYTFYPLYVEESVYSKPTEDKYFKLVKDLGNGECILGVNNNYKLRGKITIPSTYNGLVVTSLQQFQNATNASHIFFMEDSQLRLVGDGAFQMDQDSTLTPSLKGIYLPETVIEIGPRAFSNLESLEYLSVRCITENQGLLPSNLQKIGDRAFYMARLDKPGRFKIDELPNTLRVLEGEKNFQNAGPNINLASLPPLIETIGTFCFHDCKNIHIEVFGSKSSDAGAKSALKSIGQGAFQQKSSGNHSYIANIYVWDSVKTIAQGAFIGYGVEGGVDLYTNQTPPADWDNIGVKSVQEYYGEL